MNEQNFDYLKDQVKFTGFGEELEGALKEQISLKTDQFTLPYERKFGNDDVTATLHFRKGEENDMYFFNKYDLNVKPEGAKEELSQTFYIGKANNFTLKEGFNLLSGRSVHKELSKVEKTGEGDQAQYQVTDEKYNAWVQLDFKNADDNGNFKMKYYHENYGFKLDEVLGKHPIKELENSEDKTKLIQSLEKGNRQSATFVIDGNEQKRYVEAVPQYKSINIYDSNHKRLRPDQKQKDENTAAQKEGKEQKKGHQQKKDDGDSPAKKGEKEKRKRGQGIS